MLYKIIIGVVIVFGGLFAWYTLSPKQSPQSQHAPAESDSTPQQDQQDHQQENPGFGEGINKPFYSKDDLHLTHTWPGEGNFSNEETEVLLFNESESSVEIKSFDLTYAVEGKTYPHKSGTWEKFPSKTSWERTEYLNISPQYYKGEPLILTPGQKGKLHWHIQFGPQPLDGKQTVHVKLTLLKGSETITIDKQFNRDSGTVVSKDEH